MPVTEADARSFLVDALGLAVGNVEVAGEGAWSRCFGYQVDGRDYVVRFGLHVEDFDKDRRSFEWAAPNLPVPEVIDIGSAFDGFYAISTRSFGTPLEQCDARGWTTVVGSLADTIEAMRRVQLPSDSGWGLWSSSGVTTHKTWRDYLMNVTFDDPARRIYGWSKALATNDAATTTFAWGVALLDSLAKNDVTKNVAHCDLINRNVHVLDNRITGVFDWGCAIYGDHLYELALVEFWRDWYPQLDIGLVRTELWNRWRAIGYAPHHFEERMLACSLHIGLEHMAYNAFINDWTAVAQIENRMRRLASGFAERST